MRGSITRLKRRYPVAFGLATGVFLAAGAAAAAWIIYTGVSGSGAGQVGTSTLSNAVQLTADMNNVTPVTPGSPGTVYADVKLVTGAAPSETINSLSASSIQASPACNTNALHFTANPSFVGSTITGNSNDINVGTLTADSNLDPACAGATLTLNFTGTTSP